jgi:hypothetical protein
MGAKAAGASGRFSGPELQDSSAGQLSFVLAGNKQRIQMGIAEFNAAPVVFRWNEFDLGVA